MMKEGEPVAQADDSVIITVTFDDGRKKQIKLVRKPAQPENSKE